MHPQSSFQEAGEELSSAQLEQVQQHFATFKRGLEAFAKTYRQQIKGNPALRAHFTKMCLEIGIDPLSSAKGFWSETLGIGTFYHELAVQVIELCFSTREQNGGLMELAVLVERLRALRGTHATKIDRNDVLRAIEALEPLGAGYRVIEANGRQLVQSLPRTLSLDETHLLTTAAPSGLIAPAHCPHWTPERFEAAVRALVEDSLVWLDAKTPDGRPAYFVVSLVQ